ncbi:MAG TPA: glycoside hydrolase family 38 C-terminal domain-containing protein [Trebonia sp.]
MRITGVESTDLFTAGTAGVGRALQVVRVTVEATEAAEEGVTAHLRVMGAGVSTPQPFGIALGKPRESRTGEVSVAVTGSPGTELPVTAIAETVISSSGPSGTGSSGTGGGRAELGATVTVAEAGWTMWMVSHFHYDPVWWSTQGQFTEARLVLPDEDGSLPDTRTAFDLVRLHLEKARRDPDYKFVLAEIDYLKPHFDAFPHDRAFLRSLLAGGRAELVGGTYNEPNTNLTGAETTIRNAVYGMGFQRGVLGAEPASAWMLDAFGFDPGFPGLMAGAGLTSSSWARGPFHQWGPAVNTEMQFPAEFEWLSPDGSGLLTAYMANHYGAGWTLHTATDLEAALRAAYEQFRGLAPVAATRNVMLPVGSDHVIPARWVTDVAREWGTRYVWPRFVPAIPREFFAAVRADAEAEPARFWIMPQTRDMNPVYTGKDVSYADTKLAARAGEIAVLEGERLATLAWLRGAEYPAESLDKAWRQLAYGAHHDAITGTESDEVYLDLLAGWREAWQRGDAARHGAITFLAGASADDTAGSDGTGLDGPGPDGTGLAVTVVNGLARERDGMATVTVKLAAPGTPWLGVTDPVTGGPVPALADGVRRHPDGTLAEVTLTFRAREVPALGFVRYPLVAAMPPDGSAGAPALAGGWADADGLAIENDAFLVTGTAGHGALASVVDKAAGREVLNRPGNDLILQEEYQQHPRWNEGPWHLSPTGSGIAASAGEAVVRAQRSPVGSRLVASYALGDLTVTAETLLWDGADRVEFRTHVSGSIGKEHLLRVRFPAALPGGLPVYQTATAVIGRPFGAPETDVAEHWWTLENPANQWFGIGSVACASLRAGTDEVAVALGVAEVVTPDLAPSESRPAVKDLLTELARAGVTATCSRSSGTRYGSVDLDSNLPDFRIALGGPSANAFTAEILASCDPSVAKRLAQLAAENGTARLWVPASRSRAAAFAPGADLRGPRDLPALIVATADPAALDPAVRELARDVTRLRVPAEVCDGNALAPGDAPLADGAVAVFNKGTLGAAVTPDGTLWMSLFRACSGWPSGVWIDGDRRTAPDGSSFAWQHWSHMFAYALASSGGSADWRAAAFNAAAEDYNHDLVAVVTAAADADGSGLLALDGAPSVTLSALKPVGNPLAAGLPGTPSREPREVTVRLRETDGRAATARLRLAAGIEAAWRNDLLEGDSAAAAALDVADGTAHVPLGPFETVTLRVRLAEGPARVPAAERLPAAVPPPEPAQPVFTRYWLHGKGPAPAGNLPVAVHFSPTRVTLGGEAAGDGTRLALTVACGPAGGSGQVELVVPDGLAVTVAGVGGAGATPRYDLAPGEYAAWDVTVNAPPGTPDGRYFLTARITDKLGQVLEDAVLVTIGESGAPDPNLEPEELFSRLQSDVMALAGETDLEPVTPEVRLAPGESGELTVRIASHLASQLRGEAQLVSPFGTWQAAGPWTQPVTVPPGGETTVRFTVAVPATAAPGWESWLLVKLMYFGRVRYSESVRLTVA